MKHSKRDLAAIASHYTGLSALLRALPSRPVLLVLNYHRIGNPDETPYDSGVFSATAEAFDNQVQYLKKHFHLITLAEAIEIVEGKAKLKRASVLLTFDDGYLDNYECAFPVLASHGVQGVFFLPTSFIGSNRVTWWDTIAYLVKHSRKPKLTLPDLPEYDIGAAGVEPVVRALLAQYRNSSAEDGALLIDRLEAACGTPRPNGQTRCFMNWDEAAGMLHGGMAIGSHTHSHEVLSRISEPRQYEELTTSKQILEERLGRPIEAFAYPVGLPESFTAATREAVGRARYRVAFSYYGGFNFAGSVERYNVRRVAIEPMIEPRFQMRTALAAASGKYWI